jgi:hypothetical protein
MTDPQPSRESFDEQAALDELERLQRAIEESRRLRGQTMAEFDAFVRSFKSPASGATGWSPDIAVPSPSVQPEPLVQHQPTVSPLPSVQPLTTVQPPPPVDLPSMQPLQPVQQQPVQPPSMQPQPPVLEQPAEQQPPPSQASPPLPAVPVSAPLPSPLPVAELLNASVPVRPRALRLGFGALMAGLVGILAIVVAASLLTGRGGGSPQPSTPSNQRPVAQTAHAGGRPSAPTQTAAPAPAGGVRVELVTIRPVWVRALVDGERTIERELPANTRIPLHGQQVISIRAGDAGALRILLDGQDQGTLGREGFPVNRTFTAKPAAPPPNR